MGTLQRATMAMSGILPDEFCEPEYKRVQKREIRAALFCFNDKRTKIVPKESIEKTEDYNADWDKFVEHLPAKDAMYAIYDFEYKDIQSGYNDGDMDTAPVKSKMVLMSWAPDNAKPQVKMLVPSSLAGLKEIAKACSSTVQMSCMDDAVYETMASKLGIKLG